MFQVLQLRLRDDFIFITCLFTKHYLFVWGIEAVELIWLFCFQTSVVGILLLLTISYSRGFCHKGYFCSDGGLLTGGFMCCIGTDGRVPHTSTNRHRRSTGVNLMLRQWGWAPCQVRRPSLPPSRRRRFLDGKCVDDVGGPSFSCRVSHTQSWSRACQCYAWRRRLNAYSMAEHTVSLAAWQTRMISSHWRHERSPLPPLSSHHFRQ